MLQMMVKVYERTESLYSMLRNDLFIESIQLLDVLQDESKNPFTKDGSERTKLLCMRSTADVLVFKEHDYLCKNGVTNNNERRDGWESRPVYLMESYIVEELYELVKHALIVKVKDEYNVGLWAKRISPLEVYPSTLEVLSHISSFLRVVLVFQRFVEEFISFISGNEKMIDNSLPLEEVLERVLGDEFIAVKNIYSKNIKETTVSVFFFISVSKAYCDYSSIGVHVVRKTIQLV
ncbi:hypothetical protein LSM04_008956 [Trypanosoma melophagium]|uniref:uncharacterized protein n=1 Tax=Trypanosoma melophagium TaxID=715481 RepID=UPI00351A8F38|nr:hypothetical protein LSM04_008956 [Trypanosoma melophagium]